MEAHAWDGGMGLWQCKSLENKLRQFVKGPVGLKQEGACPHSIVQC